jgi:choline dehydrogenase
MGPANDPLAVVDQKLQVHGIDNLWVADASVMPTVVHANTNRKRSGPIAIGY